MRKIVGIDLAKPGSERTVVTLRGGRRAGKGAAVREAIEKHLDAGHTVHDMTTGEVRGADLAKDVTPKPAPKSKQLAKRT